MTDEVKGSVQDDTSKPAPAAWQLRNEIRLEVEAQIRPALRMEYEALYSLWKADDLDKVRKESEKIATEGIGKLFDQWKEEQKPPTDDQIQLLLNQEYASFNLQVEFNGEDDTLQTTTFVIRELPQSAEKKFYKQFKDKVLTKAGSLEALTQATMDRPFEEKAKAFLDLFDESFDMLADAVVICLNPFGKDKKVTRDWVQNNISSHRQWQLVEAQIRVNRLKDFFSKLSQSGQSTQTMLGGLNFQQLQQLVR